MSPPALAHHRFQLGLLIATWVLVPLSFVGARYLDEQPLHHVPTVIALILLWRIASRRVVSDVSFAAIVLFLWLHIVGARWIYSFVPYDDWSRGLLGGSITEWFRFRRNHYDRLVHFAFGALMVLPLVELLRDRSRMGRWTSVGVGIAVAMGTSALYEIGEWLLAVFMSPEHADAYNGQQGDAWDAQKDMAFALAGTMVTGAILLAKGRVGPIDGTVR